MKLPQASTAALLCLTLAQQRYARPVPSADTHHSAHLSAALLARHSQVQASTSSLSSRSPAGDDPLPTTGSPGKVPELTKYWSDLSKQHSDIHGASTTTPELERSASLGKGTGAVPEPVKTVERVPSFTTHSAPLSEKPGLERLSSTTSLADQPKKTSSLGKLAHFGKFGLGIGVAAGALTAGGMYFHHAHEQEKQLQKQTEEMWKKNKLYQYTEMPKLPPIPKDYPKPIIVPTP